jgi:glutamate-1-semialdehyde 2,1-aminomutase
VLVFNGCYHGTVDDTMVELVRGKTANRAGLVGQVQDLTKGAVVCEFNDLAAVEKALAKGDVAAILTEPVMTNCCMVLPEAGFLAGLRDLATRHGALLNHRRWPASQANTA